MGPFKGAGKAAVVGGKAAGKGWAPAGGKAAGKAGGKGGGAAPGYAGPRERLFNERISGKLVQWKGPFGFIMPDQRINHPSAKLRGGKIYLDQIDVDQELTGVGAPVSFFVYADGAGLGAAHCIPGKAGKMPIKTIGKAPKAAAKAAAPVFKAKGKDKGKGKGKGKGEEDGEARIAGQAPDKENRETISTDLVQGLVMDWRGQMGWIKPDEPVDHPLVKQHGKRKGQIYVHETDVEGEMPLMGAQVGFFIYTDEHGLGAEICQVLVQGDGNRPKLGKKSEEGEEEAVAEEEAAEEAADEDVEMEEGEEGKKKPAAKKAAQKLGKFGKSGAVVKGAGKGVGKKGKVKGKGKGKTQEEKGPSGPDLPRERVLDEPLMGEVIAFKGKIGWIRPTDEVDHPEAAKHGGKIYVHKNDLVGVETLEKGSTVQFFIFQDSSGLGAEEVVPC